MGTCFCKDVEEIPNINVQSLKPRLSSLILQEQLTSAKIKRAVSQTTPSWVNPVVTRIELLKGELLKLVVDTSSLNSAVLEERLKTSQNQKLEISEELKKTTKRAETLAKKSCAYLLIRQELEYILTFLDKPFR